VLATGGPYAKVSAYPEYSLGAGPRGRVVRLGGTGASGGVCADCATSTTGRSRGAPSRPRTYLDERVLLLGWAGVYLAARTVGPPTAPLCELGGGALAADPARLDLGARPLARLMPYGLTVFSVELASIPGPAYLSRNQYGSS
jgi:hypothetical protein